MLPRRVRRPPCSVGVAPSASRPAVYMEKTILELPRIYVNGGSRGFLAALVPQEMVRVLGPALVEVAIAGE